MAALIRKLQAALSSLDCFPVIAARFGPPASSRLASLGGFAARFSTAPPAGSRAGSMTSGSAGSLSSGLAMLTQPLKLRLARHSGESMLRDYSSNLVMIEPLASMSAIEDFLFPRVVRAASSPPADAAAAGAAAADAARTAAAAGSGKASGPAKASDADGSKPGSSKEGTKGKDSAAAAAGARAPASHPISTTKSQPIPEARGNRRVTRSQAARSSMDEEMQDAVKTVAGPGNAGPGSHDGAAEQEDAEEGHEFDDAHDDGAFDDDGHPIFDDDDEGGSYDEEMEDGEGDMDIQPTHVHDLHVEEPAAAGSEPAGEAGKQGAAAAGTSGRAAASGAAGRGAVGSSPGVAAAAAAAGTSGAGAAEAAEGRRQQPRAETAAAAVGHAQPKLVFFMGDTKLSAGTTVFQAVQQMFLAVSTGGAGEAGEDGQEDEAAASQPRRNAAAAGGSGRRLWDEVHTLHYRRASEVLAEEMAAAAAAAKAAAVDGSAAAESQAAAAARVGWTGSPLGELLLPQGLQSLSAGEACREVLLLLQLLEVINRQGPRIAATLDPAGTLQPGAGTAACSSSSSAAADEVKVPGQVPREEFVNQKLGSKLGQQLKDVLSICGGSMPAWVAQLVVSCKFLFPFEMRRRFFYCTAFGLGRALHHMQQLNAAESGGAATLTSDSRELRVGRLQRQKVRVSRKRILESAFKVMEMYAKQRTVLELEYFGEVGTGLGPTLEFYTLLSHDLQKRSLGLWRHEDNVKTDDMETEQGAEVSRPAVGGGERPAASVSHGAEIWHEASEFVNAPWGLFPAPLSKKQQGASVSRALDHFRLLGRTMAKTLQDSRLMDLPLSYVFYRAVMGKRLDLMDIRRFDPQLGATLERMRAALAAHRAAARGDCLRIDGVPLSDLCLTFTLPGYPEYELKPGGADVDVVESNLEEYIEAVVDATLGSGIEPQITAFREGFNEVFALTTLECFYEDELETLLCGSGEHWTVQGLADSIKFDHGYTGSSPVIKCFLEVLSELDSADQRRFLRFVTGCPRLPPGGLAALQPRLTVVRKHPSSDATPPGTTPVGSFKDASGMGTTAADCDFPSVMTCANYIKLPPYSSKEVMKQRLMYAILEGQGSFDLS